MARIFAVIIVMMPAVMASLELGSLVRREDDLGAKSPALVDWSHGASSWQDAMSAYKVENNLWTRPNFCESHVLHGSAPLTVLFGISTFWQDLKKHNVASRTAGKPLEIHVPGAAYPFEGRSDWSLLASRRPPDVPGVRIVLVLGTPWQQDNVPDMSKAKGFVENESFLQVSQVASFSKVKQSTSQPELGKIAEDDTAILCSRKSEVTKDDRSFDKADLCRDHGNGLEVVCIEKYYQDVVADLPKPDLVVMFSPGFPQIARRSWDVVLRSLLDSGVPILVNDLLDGPTNTGFDFDNARGPVLDSFFRDEAGKTLPPPGHTWAVDDTLGEGGMTLVAMQTYNARKVGAWRNPFPIFLPKHNAIIAKNIMVQLFQGRVPGAKPWKIPSPVAVHARKNLVNHIDWKAAMDETNAAEVKRSFLVATSTAYDKAMWLFYRNQIRTWFEEQIKAKHPNRQQRRMKEFVRKKWKPIVEKLGLTGKRRQTPWTLREWSFVLTKLQFSEF